MGRAGDVEGTVKDGAPGVAPAASGGRCSLCITDRLLTTVEMACLKINCSWLLFSNSTEYLSKDRILPVSLTPLTRVDRDWGLVFADRIKKRVLNILCRLVIHVPISPPILFSDCAKTNPSGTAEAVQSYYRTVFNV